MSNYNNIRYHAFISYSHADNKDLGRQWATWLHQAIETYEIPPDLTRTLGGVEKEFPARIYPIFRDEEELPADADLSDAIVKALDSSEYLVVLCSPRSAASSYVEEEIDYFKSLGKSERIISVIIDGEPNVDLYQDDQKNISDLGAECFPAPLRYKYSEQYVQTDEIANPLAADFRIINEGLKVQGWTSIEAYREYLKSLSELDKKEIDKKVEAYSEQQSLMLLKLIAGILSVPLGDLTKRDKEYQLELARQEARKLRRWLATVLMLVVITIGAGIFATIKKNEAIEAQKKEEAARKDSEYRLVEANHNMGLALLERATQEQENISNKAAYLSAEAALKLKHGPAQTKANRIWQQAISGPKPIWVSEISSHHGSDVNTVAISPNGKLLATGSFDARVRIWDIQSGNLQHTLEGHSEAVTGVRFSPDGKLLASSGLDGIIHLWVSANGAKLQTLGEGKNQYSGVAFSPDGKMLAAGSFDKSIHLLNVSTGEVIDNLEGHTGGVVSVAFSPNKNMMASASTHSVFIWNLASKKILKKLDRRTSRPFETIWEPVDRILAFSPDGKVMAYGDDSDIAVYSLTTQEKIKVPRGHEQAITSVAFSSDGKFLASGSTDKSIHVWDLASVSIKNELNGHSGSVFSLSFSPDGKLLASGSEDNTVKLWDPTSGQLLNPSNGHTNKVSHIAFSPDGKQLASGSSDETIIVWDVSTGTKVKSLLGHDRPIVNVAFSPDGNTLSSGSQDNTVVSWSLYNGQAVKSHEGRAGKVGGLFIGELENIFYAFSPQGRIFAKSSPDNTIHLWDQESGNILNTLSGHSSEIESLAFSPDGKTLASGSGDNTIKIWNTLTGKLLKSLSGHRAGINCLDFSSDGRTLVSGARDDNIRIWDISSGKSQKVIIQVPASITSIALSPGGKAIAAGFTDRSIRLWNVDSGSLVNSLFGHNGSVTTVAFSPNGKILASGSDDNTVRFWKLSNPQLESSQISTLNNHSKAISSVAFSPDGKVLASSGEDETIQLWDVAAQVTLYSIVDFSDSIAFSPNSEILAYSHNESIKLVDVSTGKIKTTFHGIQPEFGVYIVNSVAFSPDGKFLAAGNFDSNIYVWDTSTGKNVRTLRGHRGIIQNITISQDGKLLASGSADTTVRLWDMSTGKTLKILYGHSSDVKSVAFSPDRKTLASASWDNTIQLWDIESGTSLKTFQGNSPIYSILFSPDGQLLISGSEDSAIAIWETSSGKKLSNMTGHSNVVYSMSFAPDGKTLATGSFDNSIRLWNIYYEVPSEEKMELQDWIVSQRGLVDYEIAGLRFSIMPPQSNLFGKDQSY